MSRRTERMAQVAAQQASEAGRVLQAQQAAARTEAPELPLESAKPQAPERIEPAGDGEEQKRPEPRNEPRRKAMEEIVTRHRETVGELPPAPDTPKAEEPVDLPPPTPEQMLAGSKFAQSEPPAEAAPAPDAPPAPEAPKTLKQTVDGKEYDVPQTEIEDSGGERAWRIERAAKNRLEEAKAELAETKRTQAALIQWAQNQANPPQPKPSVDQLMAKAAAARFGTDEEYAAAQRELLQAFAPAPMDRNAFITEATVTMGYNAARAAFTKEFGDVLANPDLADLARLKEQRAIAPFLENGRPTWAKMAQVDWTAHFGQIGSQVRSLARPSQPQQTAQPAANAAAAPAATSGTPSQAPSEREARKASIVNLPAAAAARAAAQADPKPKTREEVFADMKKRRGIPTG